MNADHFPFYKQLDKMDCGPTCLKMVSAIYDRRFSIGFLRTLCTYTRHAITLYDLKQAAEQIGFECVASTIPIGGLQQIKLPCILHWRGHHFVVLFKIANSRYHIADPGVGLVILDKKVFQDSWFANEEPGYGIILELTATYMLYSVKEN